MYDVTGDIESRRSVGTEALCEGLVEGVSAHVGRFVDAVHETRFHKGQRAASVELLNPALLASPEEFHIGDAK